MERLEGPLGGRRYDAKDGMVLGSIFSIYSFTTPLSAASLADNQRTIVFVLQLHYGQRASSERRLGRMRVNLLGMLSGLGSVSRP